MFTLSVHPHLPILVVVANSGLLRKTQEFRIAALIPL